MPTVVLSILLIRSGNVELNTGPTSSNANSDSSDESLILNYFSIVHYNIHSVSNKTDLIRSEFRNFNIICLTETWLNHNTSDDSVNINGYKLYRRDRQTDSNGGGVCVYIRDNIYSCRRLDLELPNIECILVKVNFHNRKFLLGTFYRPPRAPAQILSSIENSFNLAVNSNIVFITGDLRYSQSRD